IYARVRDAAVTGDVAASTWLEAWGSGGRVANDGRRFAPLGIGIGRDELTHGARSRHCSLYEFDHHGQPYHMLAEASTSTEDAAIARTELREVLAALTTLPRRRRTALLLQVQEGMSNADIARTMGTTPTAVRFLLHRGRQQLREAHNKQRLQWR